MDAVGRPTVMTPDVLAKLEAAFMDGHTDTEACLIAQIDESTLYRYCQENDIFARKKELLKNNPKIKARRNIMKRINEGDVELSKWYLERKAKDEFSSKQEISTIYTSEEARSMTEFTDSIRAIAEGLTLPPRT